MPRLLAIEEPTHGRYCFKTQSGSNADMVPSLDVLELACRDLRHFRSTESGSEVNLLIDGVCGERPPTIDFPHVDLPRGEQCPEQHRGSIGKHPGDPNRHGLEVSAAG